MTPLTPSVIKTITRAWLLAEEHSDRAALHRLDLLLARWVEDAEDQHFVCAVLEELDWLHLVYDSSDEC